MKIIRLITTILLLVGLVLINTPVMALGGENNNERILVKFKPGINQKTKKDTHAHFGTLMEKDLSPLEVQVVNVPAGKAQDKIKAYQKDKNVLYAEPDYMMRAFYTPKDIYFSRQWALPRIKAPMAWDVTRGNPGIKIAVLDTGIDTSHKDLAVKVIANVNFTGSSTAEDLFGHGTHVAGIAAAITDSKTGVAGMGFNTSLMNVKVLEDNGSGYTSSIAKGIIWAADNGAKVINMSLGSPSSSRTLSEAVNYAWHKGVVIVAAAGNDGVPTRNYPAACSHVIAVAATDQQDAKAPFSNYGSWVEIAAPGTDIFSTLPDHRNNLGTLNYGSLSGTSMAAPYVAGLAGLVWSAKPGLDNTAVRQRIITSADRVGGIYAGFHIKMVNAYRAVK